MEPASGELGNLSDVELTAYLEALVRKMAKQLAPAQFLPLFVAAALGLIFVGEKLGIPAFVPMLLLLVGYLASMPMIARVWGTDLHRMEAAVELTRRGLPLPAGMRPVKPWAPVAQKRSKPPVVLMQLSIGSILLIVAGLMAGVLPEDAAMTWVAATIPLGLVFASIAWLVVVTLTAVRQARP